MIGRRHMLVANYLDDVGRMLADLDPAERAEVLAGLREHLDAVIDPAIASDDEVHRVLTDLGPPDAIAREALSGAQTTPTAPRPMSTTSLRPWVPLTRRSWVPSLVAVLLIVALGLSMLVLFGGAAFNVMTSSPAMDFEPPAPSPSPGGGGFHAPDYEDFAPLEPDPESMWSDLAGVTLGAWLFSFPLWGTAAVLLLVSPLFTTAVRTLGILMIPVSISVIVAGAGLAQVLGGSGAQSWSFLVTGPVLLVLAIITVRTILRTGRRRGLTSR